MNTCFIFKRFCRPSRVHINRLIALWGAGLVLGIFLYVRVFQTVEIDCAWLIFSECHNLAFLSVGVPIAVTALSVYCNSYVLCYPLFLIEAMARAFSAAVVFSIAGHAAWLLRAVLLFSGISSSVVMWWMLLRPRYATFAGTICTVAICTGLISSIDFFVISPFVRGLSIYF